MFSSASSSPWLAKYAICGLNAQATSAVASMIALQNRSVASGACASDAFYPFADGIHAAADAGAAIIVQPGGSVRDDETIAAADDRGVAMVFTGERHFLH